MCHYQHYHSLIHPSIPSCFEVLSAMRFVRETACFHIFYGILSIFSCVVLTVSLPSTLPTANTPSSVSPFVFVFASSTPLSLVPCPILRLGSHTCRVRSTVATCYHGSCFPIASFYLSCVSSNTGCVFMLPVCTVPT